MVVGFVCCIVDDVGGGVGGVDLLVLVVVLFDELFVG